MNETSKTEQPTVGVQPQVMRTGRWGEGRDTETTGMEELPAAVQARMMEDDPDWDWAMPCHGWIVVRLFDEGEEFERHACRVVASEEYA